VGGGKRGLVYTVCACASCVRELTVKDFVNSRLQNGMNMRDKNADFRVTECVEMASSTHTVCCFCACVAQTKHYTALFCPGGLNKHLPARMAKLYEEVPISFDQACNHFRNQ